MMRAERAFRNVRKNVIVVYKIPNDKNVKNLMSIWIPINGCSKWYKFRESEEEIKKLDDIYHTLKLENCPVLRKLYTTQNKKRNSR